MPASSILVCGATGLVGRACLERLLADPAFARVVVLSRRPLPEAVRSKDTDEKLDVHLVDFERLSEHRDLLRVDAILCALGTTIKQAGSQERFREVDFGYPLTLARLGLEEGVRHFLLVSALGAGARSRFFYNRVKGELEEALRALPYRSTTIVRPSLLLGDRPEFRLGEEVAKRFAFLFPNKYKPVHADAVAAVLVAAAREDRAGAQVIASAEIRRRSPG